MKEITRGDYRRILKEEKETYGILKEYTQQPYTMLFATIEGNMLRVHREEPKCNSRQVVDAITLACIDINGRIEGVEYDATAFENPYALQLKHAILASFDPYTREEVAQSLQENGIDMEDDDERRRYYAPYIQVLLKIEDSVHIWNKMLGSDGYFKMLEKNNGASVKESEFNYSALLPRVNEQILSKFRQE